MAKLIRDKIPSELEGKGLRFSVTTASPENLTELLFGKLREELLELEEAKSAEEAGDVLEVLQALVKKLGLTWHDVEAARLAKHEWRGGFEEGVLLHEVEGKAY